MMMKPKSIRNEPVAAGKETRNISLNNSRLNLYFLKLTCITVVSFINAHKTSGIINAFDKDVAKAAPNIPMLKVMIINGSRTALRMTAHMLMITPLFESPLDCLMA